MLRLLCGVSRHALFVAVAGIVAPLPALSAPFTVNTGTTDNGAKTITGTETGTVQSGATLSTGGTTAITLTGPSNAPGVTINNSGTITSTARGIDTSGANPPRNLTLNNNAGALISSNDDSFRLNTSIGNGTVTINNAGTIVSTVDGQTFDFASNTSATGTIRINNLATGVIRAMGNDAIRTGLGSIFIDNAGLIDSTASANRAINLNTGDLNNLSVFSVTNAATGIIQSRDDTIRITGTNVATTAANISIDNAGIIKSVGTGSGQAIDLDGLTSNAATVTITNRASGVISADDADAVRPGQNFTIYNYGLIAAYAAPVPADRPGADAIDLQFNHTGTVHNYGTITGAKSGTASDTGSQITVYNYAGATITGRNGSGVGSGGNATVVNYGTITGTIDSTSARGDGDGIDIDFSLDLTNYGLIQGLGAKGFDGGNRRNNSEGLAIGGGTIRNYGTISGAGAGIVVNNDSNVDNSRSGSAAANVTNYVGGTIIGQSSYAIRFENKTGTAADNDTIVNYGTIIGNGVITDPNSIVLLADGITPDPGSVGTLNGVTYTGTGSARFIRGDGSAIQTGEGDDVLTNHGRIVGNTGRAINLEGGNDTLNVMSGSTIVGMVDGGVGSNTLNYYKVGLSAAKKAALLLGETVNVGGTLYRNFDTFGGVTSTFTQFAGTGGTAGVASILDNMSPTQSLSAGTQMVIDQIASASDVGGAMAQLTPVAFQALNSMAVNTSSQTGQVVDQRMSNLRDGGPAMSFAGLDTFAMLDTMRAGSSLRPSAPMNSDAGADAAFAYASGGRDRVSDAFAAVEPSRGFTKAPAYSVDHTPWGMFINGNAIFGRQAATANAPQNSFTSVGITAGVDRRITDNLILGVVGGYTRTNADLDGRGSTSYIDTWLIGAYGTYYGSSWFANGAMVYGRNSYDNKRMVLGTANTSGPKGNQFGVQGSVGRDFNVGRFIVTPEAGLQYTGVWIDGYRETGPAALNMDSDHSNSLRSSLGARLRTTWVTASGTFTPELRASWQHEFLDKARDIRASFVDQALPGTFSTTTAGNGTDFGIVGAGLSTSIAARTQLSLGYDFKFGGRDFTAHQISGRIRHSF